MLGAGVDKDHFVIVSRFDKLALNVLDNFRYYTLSQWYKFQSLIGIKHVCEVTAAAVLLT